LHRSRKIEEAALRGPRIVMDKTYLIAQSEEMAKSIYDQLKQWTSTYKKSY